MRMRISVYGVENGNEANLIFNIQFPFISIFISRCSRNESGEKKTIEASTFAFMHPESLS